MFFFRRQRTLCWCSPIPSLRLRTFASDLFSNISKWWDKWCKWDIAGLLVSENVDFCKATRDEHFKMNDCCRIGNKLASGNPFSNIYKFMSLLLAADDEKARKEWNRSHKSDYFSAEWRNTKNGECLVVLCQIRHKNRWNKKSRKKQMNWGFWENRLKKPEELEWSEING